MEKKLKSNLFVIIVLGLLLTACGAEAAPTVSPEQIQASAAVMASTMSAETQAAMPTPTSTPLPTETPLPPTETPTLVPTIEIPSPTTAVTGDPCNGPLFGNPQGADAGKVGTNFMLRNSTKASITISLSLAMNPFGQCGYVSYVIAPNQSVSVVNELPYGCYSAFAFINDPKKPSTASGGPACITGPDKTTFTVSADMIKITGP